MSRIEDLVTQVGQQDDNAVPMQNMSKGQQQQQQQQEQPEPQPKGFCARIFCCFGSSSKNSKSSSSQNKANPPQQASNNSSVQNNNQNSQANQQNSVALVAPSSSSSSPAAAQPQAQTPSLPAHIPLYNPAQNRYLLRPLAPEEKGKKCLVLDLDETLVHSSFKPIPNADFIISIELENVIHRVYVRKRPGVDRFMREVGKLYEVVIFTASLAKYADPLLDILDPERVIDARLFRESCVQHYGNYVKDLTHLGRRLEHTLIIDNSPFSYMFQPDNAIPISSWFHDQSDRQLYELLPLLEQMAAPSCDDVCLFLQKKKFAFSQQS